MKLLFSAILSMNLLLFSCTEQADFNYASYYSIVNKTDKDICYVIKTTEGTDSLYSSGLDSVFTVFKMHRIVEYSSFSMDIFYPSIEIVSETLYNLTDTSRFSFVDKGLVDMSEQEKLYSRHRSGYFDDASTETNVISHSFLFFTDSVNDITEKDYTILDKFSDYYKKN